MKNLADLADLAFLVDLCPTMSAAHRHDEHFSMLSQLPPDEPAGKLFIALYLQPWLPLAMREQVAAKRFTDPQWLVEYADTLWEAWVVQLITAAILSGGPLQSEAPQHRGCSWGHFSSRARPYSQSPCCHFFPGLPSLSLAVSTSPVYICYYH